MSFEALNFKLQEADCFSSTLSLFYYNHFHNGNNYYLLSKTHKVKHFSSWTRKFKFLIKFTVDSIQIHWLLIHANRFCLHIVRLKCVLYIFGVLSLEERKMTLKLIERKEWKERKRVIQSECFPCRCSLCLEEENIASMKFGWKTEIFRSKWIWFSLCTPQWNMLNAGH